MKTPPPSDRPPESLICVATLRDGRPCRYRSRPDGVRCGVHDRPECPICFRAIGPRTSLLLPCVHAFHRDCMARWLKKSFTCPMCRADVPRGALPSEVVAPLITSDNPYHQRLTDFRLPDIIHTYLTNPVFVPTTESERALIMDVAYQSSGAREFLLHLRAAGL